VTLRLRLSLRQAGSAAAFGPGIRHGHGLGPDRAVTVTARQWHWHAVHGPAPRRRSLARCHLGLEVGPELRVTEARRRTGSGGAPRPGRRPAAAVAESRVTGI
jgi:hypothetical protein